ncbi:MAG: glycosyltransferase [Acidimicrobiia bacterium]|nr:glycosyltransferase [Acidimicrobiia bacterium]
MPDSQPKVSVSIITYNHEDYIAEAIESILGQETSFPVEILVGEDCSPDGTRQVIEELQRQHPGRITLRAYDENVGAGQNYLDGLAGARGEYIATLDGDDHWVSPHKLARQVALLEANPELSMCFHAVIESDGTDAAIAYPQERKSRYELRDLAEWIGINQSSILLRASARPEPIPDWFRDCPFGDWPTYVLWAQRGPIGYIDEVLGLHRLHGGGVWSSMRADRVAALEKNVSMIGTLLEHVAEPEERDWFVAVRARRFYDIAHELVDEGRRRDARAYVRRAWSDTGVYDRRVYRLEPFKFVLKYLCPPLERSLRSLKRRLRPGSPLRVPLDPADLAAIERDAFPVSESDRAASDAP